ncbi:threonine ammonia-lyase [Thermodesulfobacteriota bacterium]
MIPLKKIQKAYELIKAHVIETPLIYSPALSRMFGGDIYLKLENLQKTGSFKIRGATYKLITCKDRIGPEGVVAASAGNHAQGVALAARQAGIPATIVMPEWVSITKQEATRAYGGNVIICGRNIGESLAEAKRLAAEGKFFVHPFDDEDIITGQGTVGIEIFDQLEDPDLIVAPVGGGGLIAGIASAIRSINPGTQTVGVQAAVCPSAYEALQKGRAHEVEGTSSIADGINVKQIGRVNFQMLQEGVDHIVLVEEEQIAAAMLLLLERKKILTEGAGAVPMAAVLSGAVKVPRKGKTVLVISGGNVDSPLLERIVSQGLIKSGRIMRIWVRMQDVPGSLAGLLGRIAALKANVLHIYHDRSVRGTPIYTTHVELELETRGTQHIEEIEKSLTFAGYEFKTR